LTSFRFLFMVYSWIAESGPKPQQFENRIRAFAKRTRRKKTT